MNWGRLYLGALIIAVGTLLLLDNADVLDFGDVVSRWWPLAIILAGLLSLIANPRHWAIALIITAVGGTLLLNSLDVLDISAIVLPAILIFVGLIVIFGRGLGSKTVTGDQVSSFNIFSGSELSSHSKQFQGGSVSTLFGGAEIDLRDAVPAPDASLDVFTAFGGVEIRVPDGWQVNMHGLPLFGGFENATKKDTLPADAPKLDISATALFGGIEVKH